MDIFRIALVGVILVVLLSFRFKTDLSRFEINRLAEHNRKYKILSRFLAIYPGLLMLVRVLALIAAIFIAVFAGLSWGVFGGGAIAFGAILLAWLLGRMLHGVVQSLVEPHLGFFNKYFAWAGVLGRLVVIGDDPQIESDEELIHLVDTGDFLDDSTKNLVKNSLGFREKTVRESMTARDHIAFVHAKDPLTPMFLDELFASGHKLFPVVQNNLDHVVGFLLLDDVLPLDQEEKVLTREMRKTPPPVDASAPLESALRQMCEYHSTALMVADDSGKIVGILTLSDILAAIFSAAN